MTKSDLAVVCDAGPLIHLDELDCLTLLNDFSQVLIPKQVWQEVKRHRPEALVKPGLAFEEVEVNIPTHATFQSLAQALSLDLGEQAALSLMENYSQAILLTDDAAARLAATTLSYRVHGSIGILLRAVRRRQRTRDEVLDLLRVLPARSTLHIRASLLQEIITHLESHSE